MPSAAVLAIMVASVAVCAVAANVNSSSETAESDLHIHNVSQEDEYDDHQNDISEELQYQIYENLVTWLRFFFPKYELTKYSIDLTLS